MKNHRWLVFFMLVVVSVSLACNFSAGTPGEAAPIVVTQVVTVTATVASSEVILEATPTATSSVVAPPAATATLMPTQVPQEPVVITVTVEIPVTLTPTAVPTVQAPDLSACALEGTFHRYPVFRTESEIASYPAFEDGFEPEGSHFTVDLRTSVVLTDTVNSYYLTSLENAVEVSPVHVQLLSELQEGCLGYVLWLGDISPGRYFLSIEDTPVTVLPDNVGWWDPDPMVINFIR